MNEQFEWTVEDLDIGCEFTVPLSKVVWVKKNNNDPCLCYGKYPIKDSRNDLGSGRGDGVRRRYFKQSTVLATTDCA